MIEKNKIAFFKKKEVNYSLNEYLIKLVITSGVSLSLFVVFGNSNNVLSSFIFSSIAFLCLTIFSSILFFRGTKWVFFFIVAYLIKLIIGILHYTYFIDPNYFSDGSFNSMTFEYEGVFNQILMSAHDKVTKGLFFYEFYEGGVTHQEILSLISIPFVYFGDYIMTITPINDFCSLFLTMNILLISQYKLFYSPYRIKHIAIVVAYFPMTLIPSLLHRDIVGLTLMSIGLTLILLSKKIIIKYLMLFVACYLFYLQRTIYPVVIFFAFISDIIFNQDYASKEKSLIYKVFTLLICFISLPFVSSFLETDANQNYASESINVSFFILPIKILLGFIGPFPWVNFLSYETMPAYAYQLQDYLQGVFNLTFLFVVLYHRKKIDFKKCYNLLTFTGLLLILVGLFNKYMHMSYIAIGFVFLIPNLFEQISLSYFKKYYIYIFIFLFFVNVVVLTFFGNLGISTLWK